MNGETITVMKKLKIVVWIVALLLACCPVRSMAGGENHREQGVHALGNGALCVYGRGVDVLQIFGPPYSSPSMLGIQAIDSSYRIESSRIPETAVWKHRVITSSGDEAELTDFISNEGCSFVRHVETSFPVRFRVGACTEDRYAPYAQDVTVKADGRLTKRYGRVTSGYRVSIASGVPFYSNYKAPKGYEYHIITTGAMSLESDPNDPKQLILEVRSGEGALYVVVGPSVSELKRHVAAVMEMSYDEQLETCEKEWKCYSSEQTAFRVNRFAGDRLQEFNRAVDDIGVLIRSQQGEQGGVLAGIVYHMAYVRDQYGVFRGLLAMGHEAEARKILEFYFGIWQEFGYIKNAQAIGYSGIFHRHENDESEITGYLVVQAFDYYRKTGDAAFIKRILPMLEWATQAQQRNLIDGMMPFNGDETYIAGGVVPRKVMYHGSAEATLLFIEGSNRLLDFVKEQGLWSKEQTSDLEQDVAECSSRYRDNFFQDGRLWINNPEREKKVVYPETRPGVCLYPGHVDYFPVTYHFKGSLYFCEACMKRDTTGIELPAVERFNIPSANLFPIYIDAQLLTDEEKQDLLVQVVDRYRSTGRISTQDRILGYDYGMFLYALARYDHPLAGEVYDKMMALRDSAGAWVEYYVDGVPSGCPCRPWESGINIEAAIAYATKPLKLD